METNPGADTELPPTVTAAIVIIAAIEAVLIFAFWALGIFNSMA